MKICLLTDHHICTNPRLWKEALSLSKAGYAVQVITVFTSAEKKALDFQIVNEHAIELIPALNIIPDECSFLKRLYYRFRFRLAREVKLKLNIDSPFILGYGAKAIEKAAKKCKADLYIAHIDLCLYVGVQLRKQGYPVAFDIEDWYSHDYLVPERPIKLLQELEMYALKNGIYCTCPSRSMAESLQKEYSNTTIAKVIYNGFSIKENSIESNVTFSTPTLVWFSQTIGEGRGLETIIAAIRKLTSVVELHLIGDCTIEYAQFLKNIFPNELGHKIIIHPLVKHHELSTILSMHTVGLAIENNTPANKDTTISNKILQYIQAGIKVLATNTSGQKEIADYFKASVRLVPVGNPVIWAEQIENLLREPVVDKKEQLKLFNDLFSWEAQEKKLLQLVKDAISE